MGHFEPLRHYAEVHLLMEPGERGSGLVFESACSEDELNLNWQRLILTHLGEKVHRGVLTGSAVTDMKITLMSGKAHLKHTEGGDFRQATYRAVRQGLMQAESILLEPYYEFLLEVPTEMTGRALTDIQNMGGECGLPEQEQEMTVLKGRAPVAAMREYPREVAAYTRGMGHLTCTFWGYDQCQSQEEVIKAAAYDPDRDEENRPVLSSALMAQDTTCHGRRYRSICICQAVLGGNRRGWKKAGRWRDERPLPGVQGRKKSWKKSLSVPTEKWSVNGRMAGNGRSGAWMMEKRKRRIRPRQNICWSMVIM